MFHDRHLEELKRLVRRGRARLERIGEKTAKLRERVRRDYERTVNRFHRRSRELDQQIERATPDAASGDDPASDDEATAARS